MSRRLILILVAVPSMAVAQIPPASDRTDELVANARQLVAVDADGCLLNRSENEIIVCGTREIDRQQRLPFPQLAGDPGDRIRESLPKGNPEIVQQGRCYVTMNERNCFKGLSLVSVSFGGEGASLTGAAERISYVFDPGIPDADYVKQAMIKPLAPVPE
ncbi:hypothetical protein [Parasphingorhabdus sp.]|uniref:hypothetical protein n=1 Tax=Parasphingorhabdus sp. TaxID=2709688 RepID=UPI0010FE814E